MKNFPSKVEWVAEHRDGDKLYYYPGTGWISARDGLVAGFDLADVQATPDDATHVQFVQGKVQFVRQGDATCVDVWRNGVWQQVCTLQKLVGTVVRIKDGDVFGRPFENDIYTWVDVSDGWPTEGATRPIEVQFENGGLAIGVPSEFNFCGVGAQLSVRRWRYAS